MLDRRGAASPEADRLGTRVLVSGSSGLIGRAVTRRLIAQGHHVIGLDLRVPDEPIHDFFHGSVTDAELVRAALESVDGIIHLAAVSRVVDAEQNRALASRVNVAGLANTLSAARRSGNQPWFLFGSSREIYGEPASLPVSSNTPPCPINHYGRLKQMGEELTAEYGEGAGAATSILRFSNVYGDPIDHKTRVVPCFARAILSGQPINIHGGTQIFDFTFVEDVANVIATAVSRLFEGHSLPPMHVTRGCGTNLEELARFIEAAAQTEAQIRFTAARSYDVERFVGTPDRLRSELGVECGTDVRTGIGILVERMQRLETGAHAPSEARRTRPVA